MHLGRILETSKIFFIMDRNRYSFKTLFWSYTFFLIPLAFLEGLLALFHIEPVYFNELPVYGFKGFIIPILFIPFLGLIFGAFNWVMLNFGYFLYGIYLKRFKKQN
jgi:hypothetical protein